jgi:Rod binding domain-containing protein
MTTPLTSPALPPASALAGPSGLATAMDAARASGVQAPRPAGDEAAARAAAKEFEAIFVAQMLQHMFAGIETDGPFGGGRGEEVFRSQMIDHYGQMIADSGGIGITDALTREILSLQEV